MAELKTEKTAASVEKFLSAIQDEQMRADCRAIAKMMQKATGARPRMWGPGVVGFGNYHYRYASGREGDWFLTGFSPRRGQLTLYLMSGVRHFPELMKRLGKHSSGVACLYLKRLGDVDRKILDRLITASVRQVKKMYG